MLSMFADHKNSTILTMNILIAIARNVRDID